MWAPRVVVADPSFQDVVESVEAEADESVEALSLASFEPRFRERIRFGRLEWYSDAPRAALLLPELAESLREFRVAVMDKKARCHADIFEPHLCVARLLHHPLLVWIERRRTAVHLARTEMNEDHHVRGEDTAKGVDAFGEEIAPGHRVHVRVNKRRPRNDWLLERLVRRRMNAGVFQDLSHGGGTDADAELLEFTDNPTVPPTKVLRGHLERQIQSCQWFSRPVRGTVRFAASKLPKPLPASVWHNDVHEFVDVVVHCSPKPEQFCPLLRRRHNPACVDSRAEHPNLRFEEAQPQIS